MTQAAPAPVRVTELRPGDRVVRPKEHLCFIDCEAHGETADGRATHEVGIVWNSERLGAGGWYLRVGWLHHPGHGEVTVHDRDGDEVLLVGAGDPSSRAAGADRASRGTLTHGSTSE